MKILCLGDSLTYGYGVRRAAAWTTLAAGLLGCEMINRGIPGDSTGGMLARLQPELDTAKPQRLSVMGGGNDIFFSGSYTAARANIAAIVHQASARGVTPILCTPVPGDYTQAPAEWSGVVDFYAAHEMHLEYVEWLRRFARAFKIMLVDFWRLTQEHLRQPGAGPFYLDGLHPNEDGNAFMAKVYSEALRAAFPGPR